MERFRVAYCEQGAVAAAIRSMKHSHLGLAITTVAGPEALVEVVQREQAQLCILDSDPRSLEVASQLKGLPQGRRPKVMVLVDPKDTPMLQEMMSKVDEWLFLPCGSRQVVSTVLSVLGRKSRLPLTEPVPVQLGSRRKASFWAVNIDSRGLLLAGNELIDANADQKICLKLPTGNLWVNGRVVRHEELGQGHRFGVRFVKLSPEAQLALATFDSMVFSYWGDVCMVELRYQITGDVDLTGVVNHLRENMVFDLSAVSRINSMGVTRWLEMIDLIKDRCRNVFYIRCTWPFTYLATLIPGFLGPGRLLSAFLPYTCEECSLEQEMLVDVQREFQGGRAPVRFCQNCTGDLTAEAKASEIARLAGE